MQTTQAFGELVKKLIDVKMYAVLALLVPEWLSPQFSSPLSFYFLVCPESAKRVEVGGEGVN